MMMLRRWRWGDDPGDWGEVVTRALRRRTQRSKWERRSRDDEVGIGVMCFENGGRANKPGMQVASSYWKRQENGFSPESPEEHLDSATLWHWPQISELQSSKRINVCWFKLPYCDT